MLDVGDTVTVSGRLDIRYQEGGPYNLFLSDCSIVKIETARDPIPWSDVWNEGWNDVYRQVRQSVVGVASNNNGGNRAGWVYENGWAITAEHCVEGESVVEILYEDDAGLQIAEGQVKGWGQAAIRLRAPTGQGGGQPGRCITS